MLLTWSIMPPIRLSKDTEIPILVLWKLYVKGLQQFPDIWRTRDSRIHGVVSVREAGADGLIYVQHVGVLVETIWV
jgi:hypothetical protein